MTDSDKTEEIRGIFVLGVLAVLATVRFQQSEMIVFIGQAKVNIIIFFDITLALWSLYAFFMVLGLSSDVIGDVASRLFRDTAKLYLQLSFVALAFLAILFGYYGYGTRLLWAFTVFGVLAVCMLYIRLRQSGKSIKLGQINLKNVGKSTARILVAITVVWCLMYIMYGVDEFWIIPSAVVASAVIVLYCIVRRNLKTLPEE